MQAECKETAARHSSLALTSGGLSILATLPAALEKHGIQLPEQQQQQVAAYCQLLWAWNEKLNLTRHGDFDTFVARDVVDSMQLAELLMAGERVLDIGSGGGVPGLLLAILRPDVTVTLSDSIRKKTRALEDMVTQLELPTEVLTGRVQDLLPQHHFGTLVARAVGPLPKIIRWVEPYWQSIDRLLLIKGPRWVDERGEARHRGLLKKLALRKVKSYPMPGTDSESVILSVTRSSK